MADLAYEKLLYEEGYTLIAGTDEAGRGSLAGPLVVAAVILPKGYENPAINDSKQLTDQQRRKLFNQIKLVAIDYSITIIEIDEIDRLNIYQASKVGMIRCLEKLRTYDAVLTDAMPLKELNRRVISLVHGDALSTSIAAASIIAKVTRDDIMIQLHPLYPHYDFAANKGYGTKQHMQALAEHGVSVVHRRSYEPVKSMIKPQLDI